MQPGRRPSRLAARCCAPPCSHLRVTAMERSSASASSLRAQRSNPDCQPRRDSGLLRCARNDGVRGHGRRCFNSKLARRHTPASSRHVLPEPCFRLAPLSEQRAQGRPGAGRAPTVRCARIARRTDAQRHTGAAKQPAFPAQWLYGLCRALPGERCTIAPVALRAIARLDAQTPGVRTTRFCRTRDRARRAARQSLA
ncbi:hypothetical protein SAMN04487925_1185 [Bradyrhizobium sp. cf659]|nr:hypothetical protein SAMN04487925_1185 [Bradyrhizobium sp. cf659]